MGEEKVPSAWKMVRIEEGDNWYDMKGGGEYRVGQRKSRGRQPFMIGMEEPTQWKKRWESIIREDNAIICTCLWTTLNTTNCSFSIIIPPLPFPFSNFHAPFHLHFSSTFQSASTYRTNALHLCFQSLISCQFWLSLSLFFFFFFLFSFFFQLKTVMNMAVFVFSVWKTRNWEVCC